MVQKKIPGKGWEFIVYNKLDQVVMTQDANMRNNTPQQWGFTKYDAQGRSIITGIYTYSGSNADINVNQPDTTELHFLQYRVYNITTNVRWEARSSGTASGYDGLSDPVGQAYTFLNINYYDDYTFTGQPSTFLTPSGTSTATKGLLTGTSTNVLNSTDMLWSVNYYDNLGRQTSLYKQHYYNGANNPMNYDFITNTYNFNNQITTTKRQHYNTTNLSGVVLTINNKYIYDHVGRKLKTWEQIQNNTATADMPTLLSQLKYNEVGQLITKSLHSTDSISFLQAINYKYNERGWLLSSSATLFAMTLYYNTLTNKYYNGNIAYQYWGAPGALNTHYTYTYDNLNRLKGGVSNTLYKEDSLNYDLMGNITALKRYSAGSLIDLLTYNYTDVNGNPGNQLQSINDATNIDDGQIRGTTIFQYDGNGNLTSDPGKGTGGISYTYNILNLPKAVSGGKNIAYYYDAAGEKLRRVSPATNNTDYMSGIEYDNNSGSSTLSFVLTEEGKAIPISATAYNYQYFLSDNLGNTRVTFDTQGGTVTPYQYDDYFPFGMVIIPAVVPAVKNEYLYNKKELQEELGEYDYGARFYDPVIARWKVVDPMAEEDRHTTPYGYTFDDPIRHTDPDGMFGEDANGCGCPPDCPGGVSTPVKVTFGTIFGGSVATAGAMEAGGIVTGPGELAVTAGAVVVVVVGAAAGGLVALWNALTPSSSAGPTQGMSSVYDQSPTSTSQPAQPPIVQNTHTENNGAIYKVPGHATKSGKPYIGRHNKPHPQQTRKSNDGRDRTKAEVIDAYDPNKPGEGSYKEQKAIDDNGGVDNLDNKRNEVTPERMKEIKPQHEVEHANNNGN